MLAYLFWHRPRPGIEAAEYEEAQRGFHASLEVESACFRVEQLPFDSGGGYAADFLAGIEAGTSVWQRQMVLGPAPEFCVASEEGAPAPCRRVRL